jgi:hypothetical protein
MSRKRNGSSASVIRRALVETLEHRCLLSGSPYDDRGWLSIIVDNTVASTLAPKLERWKQSLVGDGFKIAPDQAGVLSHNAAPRMNDELYVWKNTDPPGPVTILSQQPGALNQYKADIQSVKNIINADWNAIPGPEENKKLTVVLVGHVTVPYSGADAGTTHEASAGPTDLYYADLDGTPTAVGRLVDPSA